MQQTLYEHTQMQCVINEKNQALQDQQTDVLLAVKFQVNVIVSEISNTTEVMTSLEREARDLRRP